MCTCHELFWRPLWLVPSLSPVSCPCLLVPYLMDQYCAGVVSPPMVYDYFPFPCFPCFLTIYCMSSKIYWCIWTRYCPCQQLWIINALLLSFYFPWQLLWIVYAFLSSIAMYSDLLRECTVYWHVFCPLLWSLYCLVLLDVAFFPKLFISSILFMQWINFIIVIKHKYYKLFLESLIQKPMALATSYWLGLDIRFFNMLVC